jgi:hypothetical protein
MIKNLSIGLALCVGVALGAAVQAKLPAPALTDAQKAAAAEKAAKEKEAAAKEAELLGKYQDKAVANYKKGKGASSAKAASTSGKR